MKDADTNTVTEVSTVFTTSDKHQKTVESGLPLVHTTMVLRGEKHKHQWITVMYSSPLVFLLYQRWPAETVISPLAWLSPVWETEKGRASGPTAESAADQLRKLSRHVSPTHLETSWQRQSLSKKKINFIFFSVPCLKKRNELLPYYLLRAGSTDNSVSPS